MGVIYGMRECRVSLVEAELDSGDLYAIYQEFLLQRVFSSPPQAWYQPTFAGLRPPAIKHGPPFAHSFARQRNPPKQ